ncbi:protein of unknown function [Taphrina deformans PYCC 5710]|uniref:NADH-ubiquinone oxidoreductase 21 kDa subunit n=1 Tax=Taphrina deformans (strain PYCC 5710 / ATCC 11124 / CBS 356.35 / IMI 108563 / JCM 9778 / NBRC 8474) TaxID=1097556 RepID=R4XL73_TAPDE|nr:protein of unknown function [Taphrina deformans PYCC 5710]|eukprot:CCG84059.1 protein of unknown function [Taphrina deformans PYCC 5710]
MAHTAQDLATPFPVIDTDPHFFRVIKYTRLSDWVYAAGLSAAFPGIMTYWESKEPSTAKAAMPSVMRLSWTIGAVGGFLFAYNRSASRLWGWTENAAEVERDAVDGAALARAGKKIYGDSELSPYMQGVAARNSTFSGLMFGLAPWFNFVNHSHHGVDVAKYGSKEQ